MAEKNSLEKIVASGNIFELVQILQADGRVFEIARRAPGVRVIIHDEPAGKILLSREHRHEIGTWDYRLPGGKVFDTLAQYSDFRDSDQDIRVAAAAKAIEEVQQEVGIEVSQLEHYKTSVLGATVKWDLHVFEATKWQLSESGQQFEVGESIEAGHWATYREARQMILSGAMSEERIALILLRWLEPKLTQDR